jgi:hypothetical protein
LQSFRLTRHPVSYPEHERKIWIENPKLYHEYRKYVEDGIMAYTAEAGFTYGSREQVSMEESIRSHMVKMLESRPDILKTLLPDFPPGCRRLVVTPHSG